MKKLFLIILFTNLILVKMSFAFTEMTPRTLEQNIQRANQNNKQAKQQIITLWEQQLSKIDTKEYTANEALSRMQKMIEQKKVQSYILERGQYRYVEGNNTAYVVGENVFMRSQPNTDANIITKLNTKTTTYLTYLGEWKHPKSGERWVCVRNSAGKIGWIFGKYVQLVPNATFNNIVALIKGKPTLVATANTNNSINNSVKTAKNIQDIQGIKGINLISTENHLNKTLKRYGVYAFIAWLVALLIIFHILNWKFNLYNILQFVFWTVIVIAAGTVAWLILYYFIWKEIVLPILKGIAIILGLFIVLVFMTKDGWIIPIMIENEINNRKIEKALNDLKNS